MYRDPKPPSKGGPDDLENRKADELYRTMPAVAFPPGSAIPPRRWHERPGDWSSRSNIAGRSRVLPTSTTRCSPNRADAQRSARGPFGTAVAGPDQRSAAACQPQAGGLRALGSERRQCRAPAIGRSAGSLPDMRRAPHRENPNETFASWNQPNDYDRNQERTHRPHHRAAAPGRRAVHVEARTGHSWHRGVSRQYAGPTTTARSAAVQPSVVSTPLGDEICALTRLALLCSPYRHQSRPAGNGSPS